MGDDSNRNTTQPGVAMQATQADLTRILLLEDDEDKFEQRLVRVLRVRVHKFIPHAWFNGASVECGNLFRDGHFYGCICLSQSVAEGLAKFVLEAHGDKKSARGKRLIDKLKKLKARARNEQVMSRRCLEAFERIAGSDRNDFHHLNETVITDRGKLEKRAEECVMALYDIESELFGYDISDGRLVPHDPKYWPQDGEFLRVHLRSY